MFLFVVFMVSMFFFIIIAGALALVLVLVFQYNPNNNKNITDKQDNKTNVNSNYTKKTTLLTENEKKFYNVLFEIINKEEIHAPRGGDIKNQGWGETIQELRLSLLPSISAPYLHHLG